MGYAMDRGFWLATADGESSITRTDIKKDPTLIKQKQISFSMLNKFYDIQENDIFSKVIMERYNISLQEMGQQSKDAANKLYSDYAKSQNIEPKLKRYNFKPWECLSLKGTEQYVSEAKNIAKPFFDPVIHKAKSLNVFTDD